MEIKIKKESNTPWACAKVIEEDKIVDLWNQLGKRKPDTQKGNGGRPTRQKWKRWYTTDNRKASDRSWPVQSFVVPCMEMHNKD